MCKHYDIDLVMDWQPRETEIVRYADMLIKDVDFSDFYLSDEDFSVLQRRLGPFLCDYFASSFTFRMKPFASRYLCEGAVGMDAFTLSWREGRGFFHPPVHKNVDVVRYVKEQEAEGILVVPHWPGSAFWAFLKAEERILMKMKFRPFLVAPKYFKNRTFSGRPKFDFVVFHMKFKKRFS